MDLCETNNSRARQLSDNEEDSASSPSTPVKTPKLAVNNFVDQMSWISHPAKQSSPQSQALGN